MSSPVPYLDFQQFKIEELIKKYDFFSTNKLFAEVYKVQQKENGHFYIANVSRPEDKDDDEQSPMRMTKIIYNIDYPSVLEIIGYSKAKFENELRTVVITEYYPNGNLSDMINSEKSGNPFPGWNMTKKLISIYGIASGILYMHMRNYIHRDLKPSKIVMDESLFPKIRGFNVLISCDDEAMEKHFKGTPEYMAPEILRREQSTKAMDVYSFAMIVYELITLKKPFEDIHNTNIIKILQRVQQGNMPEIDDSVPESFKKLIQQCWAQEPDERPTFNQIVHSLRTDPGFIIDGVNKDEYLDYIKYLDHYSIIKAKRRSSLSVSTEEEVQQLRDQLASKTDENNQLREEIEKLKRSLLEEKEKYNDAMQQLENLQKQ
ncbi:hypothetical protein M9Y10_013351 [Tritrichomonas musculus]|uniref:Protein kinase domain-containing protein n=1 Tax=Tritrichomonas musculus TaxID=1915356 RepID=A0ABR2I887_9EUKA